MIQPNKGTTVKFIDSRRVLVGLITLSTFTAPALTQEIYGEEDER